MGDHSAREAALREIAKKRVVVTLPGMEQLPRRHDLTFRSHQGTELPMDVYYPSRSPIRPCPLVLLPMAYPDPTARVRTYGPLTSWAQLLAASGMAAVVYGTEAPADDVHALVRYLRADADALGLDADRFGVLAASGNAAVGLSALLRDRRLRCGALLYGYTMDIDCSTTVAEMARQMGFADACAGMSVDDLSADVSLLLVRAGQDQFPGLNAALDALVERALARNLPLSLINHAAGAHGFDLDEDTAISRGIVHHVLTFMRLHLGESPHIFGRDRRTLLANILEQGDS